MAEGEWVTCDVGGTGTDTQRHRTSSSGRPDTSLQNTYWREGRGMGGFD